MEVESTDLSLEQSIDQALTESVVDGGGDWVKIESEEEVALKNTEKIAKLERLVEDLQQQLDLANQQIVAERAKADKFATGLEVAVKAVLKHNPVTVEEVQVVVNGDLTEKQFSVLTSLARFSSDNRPMISFTNLRVGDTVLFFPTNTGNYLAFGSSRNCFLSPDSVAAFQLKEKKREFVLAEVVELSQHTVGAVGADGEKDANPFSLKNGQIYSVLTCTQSPALA